MPINPMPVIHYKGTSPYNHPPHDNRSVRSFIHGSYHNQAHWVRGCIRKAISTSGLTGRALPTPQRVFGLIQIEPTITTEVIGARMNKGRNRLYTERYINAMTELCRRASVFIEQERQAREDAPLACDVIAIADYLASNGSSVELAAFDNLMRAAKREVPA